ncbi:tetrahydrofolate synthase [Clarireedia jacksonii]
MADVRITLEQAEQELKQKIQNCTNRSQEWHAEDKIEYQKRAENDRKREERRAKEDAELRKRRHEEDKALRRRREREAAEFEKAIRNARTLIYVIQSGAPSSHERRTREKAHARAQADEQGKSAMTFWAYVQSWQQKDREIFGPAYDEFASDVKEFVRDNSKGFPTIRTFGCKRQKCIKAEKLNICQHDLEYVLRGSGKFTKEWLKNQRIQWHTDKWVTKDSDSSDSKKSKPSFS